MTAQNKNNSVLATTDILVFSTDTTSAATASNLSEARQGASAVNAIQNGKGYFASGFTATGAADRTLIDIMATPTDQRYSVQSATLMYGGAEGMSSNNKGYIAGGSTNGNAAYVVDGFKLNYFNDTIASQSSANLSQALQEITGISANEADPGIITGYSLAGVGIGI